MGSKCVEKISHNTDKCHSRNGLQVFLKDDGTYDGYCFSCGTVVLDPYHDRPKGYKPVVHVKTQEEIDEELREVSDYNTKDLPGRKLRKDSLAYFGVKVGVSEQDGETPNSVYFPYKSNGVLRGYKSRTLDPKRFWAVGTTKEVDLFGWEEAVASGGKKLFITEGEFDAVALYQIFKDNNKGTQYADYNPAVVSLINGAGSATRDLTKFLPKIRQSFKEIVLVFDSDEPGQKAAEAVIKAIPDAMIATLPAKDVNECLIKGRSKAVYAATQFNAAKPKNTRIVTGRDLHEGAKAAPKFGFSWPWKHITRATRGIRLGETIYIGAGQKQG